MNVEEFLIVDINDSEVSEFNDLKLIHEIRGRFLHLTSILERIMKEYCNEFGHDKGYGRLKDLFIKKITENNLNNTDQFYEFVKSLNEVNPERNQWAHGFLYYKKRFDEKSNNFIRLEIVNKPLGQNVESIRHPYFKKIDENFEVIIKWLKKNDLWKIKNCSIREN